MTDARHLCPCGRPIHDGSHLCANCVGAMRRDLRNLAERWDDLEAALTSPAAAPIYLTAPEKPDGDNTGNAVGISLNEAVTRARTLTSELAWFLVQVVRDDYDERGRAFTLPADQGVPSLLVWVERWHLTHLVTDGSQETAHELSSDARKAEKASFDALNAARTVHVGIACTDHATSEMGERVPCDGHMTARATPGIMPDLVCSADSSHRVGPDAWQRDGWRGRFARPMDPAGLARLAKRLA